MRVSTSNTMTTKRSNVGMRTTTERYGTLNLGLDSLRLSPRVLLVLVDGFGNLLDCDGLEFRLLGIYRYFHSLPHLVSPV